MSVALCDRLRGNHAMLAKDEVDTTRAMLDAFSNGSNNRRANDVPQHSLQKLTLSHLYLLVTLKDPLYLIHRRKIHLHLRIAYQVCHFVG